MSEPKSTEKSPTPHTNNFTLPIWFLRIIVKLRIRGIVKDIVLLEQKYQFAIRYLLFLCFFSCFYLLGQKAFDKAIYGIGTYLFTIPVPLSIELLSGFLLIIAASYLLSKNSQRLLVLSLYVGIPVSLWFIGQVLRFSSSNTYHCSIIYITICAIALARIGCSIYKFYKKENYPIIEKIGLTTDEPLNDEESYDLLGFNSLANSYTNYILELLYPKEKEKQETPSNVFGVEGGWGSGKTSFLNIIKSKIGKMKGVIQVSFSPWMSSSVEILTLDFFNTLAEQIPQLQLRKEIRRYGQALSNIDSKGAGKVLNELYPAPSLDAQFKEIEQAIKANNLKIVVYVDDLDRMDAPEILATFKLIRNTARFSNMVYLVAYDREYVVSQLNKHFGSEKEEDKHRGLGNSYLEKIIQQVLRIPYANDYSDVLKLLASLEVNGLPTEITNKIDTIRKAKRIANQTLSLKNPIKKYNIRYEIDLVLFSYFLLYDYQCYNILKKIHPLIREKTLPSTVNYEYLEKKLIDLVERELNSLFSSDKKTIESKLQLFHLFTRGNDDGIFGGPKQDSSNNRNISFVNELDKYLLVKSFSAEYNNISAEEFDRLIQAQNK